MTNNLSFLNTQDLVGDLIVEGRIETRASTPVTQSGWFMFSVQDGGQPPTDL